MTRIVKGLGCGVGREGPRPYFEGEHAATNKPPEDEDESARKKHKHLLR